jgi:hypothetical protein
VFPRVLCDILQQKRGQSERWPEVRVGEARTCREEDSNWHIGIG